MDKPFFKRIVWAVDTLEPLEFQQNAQFILGALTRDSSAEVFPVHIQNYLSPNGEALSTYEEAYQALSEKRLKQLREKSDIAQMQQGDILINREGKVRRAINMLLDYAKERNANLIVASTHSRKGIDKFFMGSFAETLLLKSELPLITVNPKTTVREKISKILIPTTFDEKFRPAFQKVLELCSTLDASLTAYYKEPFIPMMDGYIELLRILEEEAKTRKEEAERFLKLAHDQNVRLEIEMDTKPGNVAEEIVSYAGDHKFDLIAMVSQTSQFASPRLGSICRKVVRNAECPVWTFKTDDYVEGEID